MSTEQTRNHTQKNFFLLLFHCSFNKILSPTNTMNSLTMQIVYRFCWQKFNWNEHFQLFFKNYFFRLSIDEYTIFFLLFNVTWLRMNSYVSVSCMAAAIFQYVVCFAASFLTIHNMSAIFVEFAALPTHWRHRFRWCNRFKRYFKISSDNFLKYSWEKFSIFFCGLKREKLIFCIYDGVKTFIWEKKRFYKIFFSFFYFF